MGTLGGGFVLRGGRVGGELVEGLGGEGWPAEVLGERARYMWKEMIRPGRYRHPVYGWVLDVTGERICGWEENFRKLAKVGHRPFVPVRHGGLDATRNLGWVVEMKVEGGSLWGLHQLIGEDAHLAAARNESSLCIVPGWRDGEGVEYGEVIEHNALCPDPVVTGLGGFVEASAGAAAGPGAGGAERFVFERFGEVEESGELVALRIEAEGLRGRVAEMEGLRLRVGELEGRLADRERAFVFEREGMELLAEADLGAIGELVKGGRVTPAVGRRLGEILARGKEGLAVMALSRGQGETGRIGRRVIEALLENVPMEMGEKFGVQVLGRGEERGDEEDRRFGEMRGRKMNGGGFVKA